MAGGSFGGGDGSELTPYLVEDALDLDAVRNDDSRAYYKQTQNIDLNISPFNEGEGWLPIGDFSNRFRGNYDGDNNTITNLYINRTSKYTGLFGFCVGNELKNIKLINVLITNSGDYRCGGLAGMTDGSIVDNCSVAGSISLSSSADSVGGLIGMASGGANYMPISNCSTNVIISSEVGASERIGGLIGYGGRINLYNSYSTGIVRGVNDVGGLIGRTGGQYGIAHVSFCYSTCDVYSFSTATGTGGLIGTSFRTNLSRSFARGNITSNNRGKGTSRFGTGGLVGGESHYSTRFLNIAQCYSTGAVNGRTGSNMGGLVGTISHRITITNSVYDSETSGQSDTNNGSIPKTTAEMKTKSTYTDLGWSF